MHFSGHHGGQIRLWFDIGVGVERSSSMITLPCGLFGREGGSLTKR